MEKVTVINVKGEKVNDITLSKEVFGITPNDTTLYDAIRLARNSRRQGTAETKTRSEVSGGGRKPWRQKGTGRARQGSIRAAQWYHGGIVFGPTPDRNYTKKMNRKERRLALKSALTYKAREKELIIVDNIKFETNKTKEMMLLLNKLDLVNEKILLVINELDENICLASRNIGNIKVVLPEEVNTYDIVASDTMIITEAAIKKLEEVLL